MKHCKAWLLRAVTVAVTFAVLAGSATADATLRAVMHSDLKILDPIWTSTYITRSHGFMIYDTLFGMDAAGDVKPQMVEQYTISADGLIHEFLLRAGLVWHDGQSVTAEDCVASIRRWAARDPVGQRLMMFVAAVQAIDDRTFRITLKEKTSLLPYALGKRGGNIAFMMPKRVANTDPFKQISDYTGSGPFIFKQDEWQPGVKVVYVKFDKYKPRPEPASGHAGGKVVKVNRVEWLTISDHQTAVDALMKGEVDFIALPPHDLLPLLAASADVKLVTLNPLGDQYAFRPNWLHKPFDNPKIRQALWYAFNQKDFLDAAVGNARYYTTCKAFFVCGTSLASEEGMDGRLDSSFEKARALLREAGYDGTPIVLMQSIDVAVLKDLAPVAKSLMEKAGFKVDLQSMDHQTLSARRAKKDPPHAGGWHAYLTSLQAGEILDPISAQFFNAACEKATFGWPCDPELERLRDQFAREIDPAKQKSIAEVVQLRALEVTTHIPLGQWTTAAASRCNVDGWLVGSLPVFWNVEKKQ
jgi:peptide/nickel transport system substrate-binding protein